MKLEELEAAALELDARARARLAESLLSSLETLSDAENAQLWAEEAQRRDAELDKAADQARPADEVLRDARSRLGRNAAHRIITLLRSNSTRPLSITNGSTLDLGLLS